MDSTNHQSNPGSPRRSSMRAPLSNYSAASPLGAVRAQPRRLDLSLDSEERLASAPLSPVYIQTQQVALPSSAQIESLSSNASMTSFSHLSAEPQGPPPPPKHTTPAFASSRDLDTGSRPLSSVSFSPTTQAFPDRRSSLSPTHFLAEGRAMEQFQKLSSPPGPLSVDSPQIIATDEAGNQNLLEQTDDVGSFEPPPEPLSYFHTLADNEESQKAGNARPTSETPSSMGSDGLARPMSTLLLDERSRSASPGLSVPRVSEGRRRGSPGARPKSYIEQLNDPYVDQAPVAVNLNNDSLRPSVGLNASLLSSAKTFEMYKANIKKTPDQKVQYDFALFMVQAATEARIASPNSKPVNTDSPLSNPDNLVKEARKILEKLASNSYPFAQYYLADGLASGTFTRNGKSDDDAAFPLFVAASKHGHAEAGYRAGLCYEYGWGCSKSGPRAEQFFRASASKGHPGSMARLSKACLSGDLGNPVSEREGVRWLRRAAEAADAQFNDAPYLLARLHENGFGSDVFKDLSYAATLYTRAAELGHAEAAYRMGKAYEHAEIDCPNDPPLSVHFYTLAAQQGHPEAMMGLVAWYMVGAPGFLEPDETEAFEWAKMAADTGLPRAAYAYAYFYESGVGCRRDPLEANKWYVRAAEMGEERAKLRLKMLRDAAAGKHLTTALPQVEEKEGRKSRSKSRNREGGEGEKKKKFGIF